MLELYTNENGRRLRCGYTTGTCAALAAGAAVRLLLTGSAPAEATVTTPRGVPVTTAVRVLGSATCAVRKDGGDDVDATDGAWIAVTAALRPEGVTIDGGEGVGRVTMPGLDQPVGAAAINSVPRRMIAGAAAEAAAACGYGGGLALTVSVPGGAALAEKTFNPQLGIVGGISILGTTGIVEPRSLRALRDSLAVEVRALGARGVREAIVTPGNYGAHFLSRFPGLAAMPTVQCANFLGDTADFCREAGLETVLLVGHIGKLVKLAGGIMDTHSRTADCRRELFTAHAALAGASRDTAAALMAAATSDACLAILDEAGLRAPVLASLTAAAEEHLARRAAPMRTGLVMFSNSYGLLAVSDTAKEILNDWGQTL